MYRIRARKRPDNFELDVAIEISASGLVALFGRSGCGKTTLANIVAGLLDADEARIEIDGAVLEDTGAGARVPAEKRRIGYVFQDARLFPHMDVHGNLRYGERRARGDGRAITFDFVVQLLGLQPLLSRRAHQLSGGEKQRVALGRALLSRRSLLWPSCPWASPSRSR